MKTVPSVYTHLMNELNTIYLSLSTQEAVGTNFRKHMIDLHVDDVDNSNIRWEHKTTLCWRIYKLLV